MARHCVCIFSPKPRLTRTGQVPPKNLKTVLGFDELHPTFGNQAAVIVKNGDTRKILNFSVEPPCSMTLDTAFRPIKLDIRTLTGLLFGKIPI